MHGCWMRPVEDFRLPPSLIQTELPLALLPNPCRLQHPHLGKTKNAAFQNRMAHLNNLNSTKMSIRAHASRIEFSSRTRAAQKYPAQNSTWKSLVFNMHVSKW